MTQEELKKQFLDFAEFNLDNEKILESVIELLDNIANELFENGYNYESNRIGTCVLILKEILKEGK